jgi:DNA-binding transcriptional LysR family regulator
MLIKYLDKIYTFLIINKENSFSKASRVLGISQPAVTQQIRNLENFLGVTLFERRKKGVILTKEGQNFLNYAKEFEKFLNNLDKKLYDFMHSDSPFLIGASQTIGTYVLPSYIKYFKNLINKDINLIIKNNDEIIDDIKKGFLDIGFVTKKNIEVNLAKWKEDELVVFSNKPLPRVLELDDLREYKIICREENSSTREFIREQFDRFNLNCDDLNVVSIVHNSTALKYTILNSNEQFVSIISKVVIEEKLKTKRLYFSKLKGVSLKRKIYIAYKDESSEIQALINFLKN